MTSLGCGSEVLYLASWGTVNASCGSVSAPCLEIKQIITHNESEIEFLTDIQCDADSPLLNRSITISGNDHTLACAANTLLFQIHEISITIRNLTVQGPTILHGDGGILKIVRVPFSPPLGIFPPLSCGVFSPFVGIFNLF